MAVVNLWSGLRRLADGQTAVTVVVDRDARALELLPANVRLAPLDHKSQIYLATIDRENLVRQPGDTDFD